MEEEVQSRDLNSPDNISHILKQDRHPLYDKSPSNKSPVHSPQKKLSMFKSNAGEKPPEIVP